MKKTPGSYLAIFIKYSFCQAYCFKAYQLNAQNLLSFALNMITGNLKDVMETQEFKHVASNCPEILVEILKKISSIQ
jgi:hypothetical protein